jgi:N-acetylglucosamine kinase-like BadF-type ATPase
MTTGVVIGVDGGGSKSLVAVADARGRIVRQGRGGGVNPIDNRRWRENLVALLRPFSDQPDLAGVAVALPVHGEVEAASEAQRAVVAELFPRVPQRVLNDVDAAQVGAFAGGAGILVLSGTGSMAWARDDAGRLWRTGGWGDVIGDEGSSYWIGRRVLSRISQALDGRAGETPLTAAVFAHLGLAMTDPMDALQGWVPLQRNLRAEIASLAAVAGRLADAGDPVSLGIVGEAAAELARHHRAIAARANLPAAWSYAGGSFGCRALRDALAAAIGVAPLAPALPPVGGALLVAAGLPGWPRGPAWIETLAASISGGAAGAEQPQPDA